MKHLKVYISAIISLALTAPVIADDMVEATIADIVIESADMTGEFSTLLAAVIKADLAGALDGKRQFTVFAPTNDAFDAAAVAVLGAGNTGADLVDALPADALASVLLYHVAPGERMSGDVVASSRIRTMSREFISVEVSTDPLNVALSGATSANIAKDTDGNLLVDIEASNGVIHVIDFVLLSEDWVNENL